MANEPLKGVAPQVQIPRPVAPAQPQTAPAQAAPTMATAPATVVEPMKERTQENFEKLLESNKQLYEMNQANTVLIQQMLSQQTQPRANQTPQAATLNGQNPAQQPNTQDVKVNPNDFIEKDPITGERFINESKLQSTLAKIQGEAEQARELAQNYMNITRQQEKERQEKEAYGSYPELNPRGTKYDSDFNKKTRAFLTDSMLNPLEYGGRALSFKEAADIVRAGAQPTAQQVVQAQVVQQVEETQTNPTAPTANQITKEQASATVANQPQQSQAEISEEEMQRQRILTRRGNDDVLAERLKYTDHIYGPNSGTGESEQ